METLCIQMNGRLCLHVSPIYWHMYAYKHVLIYFANICLHVADQVRYISAMFMQRYDAYHEDRPQPLVLTMKLDHPKMCRFGVFLKQYIIIVCQAHAWSLVHRCLSRCAPVLMSAYPRLTRVSRERPRSMV